MADHLVRCLLGDRPIRVVAAITTGVAREAARRHRVVAGGQIALARGATAGLLLATLTKGGERVTLQILGDGPLGPITIDATDAGTARVFLQNAEHLVPAAPGARVPLADAVGRRGVVSVMRDLGLKECFRGQSALVSGEIDADVERYLTESEQIESALGCDAFLEAGGHIAISAGVLFQCLPSAGRHAELVVEMRERLRGGALLAALGGRVDLDAVDLVRTLLGPHAAAVEVLDRRDASFACPCSRDRVLGGMTLLSDDDLQAMIEEDQGAEVTCDFCAERYEVSADELAEIRANRTPHASA